MKDKLKFIIPVILIILLIIMGAWYLFLRGSANDQEPDLIETPPSISKVNTLPLAQRPFISLIPHDNPSRCKGVDLKIESLKNKEKSAEYELEYTTEKLIQGVFGMRDLTETDADHQSLEFGTCSKGRCKCDDDINGGSLKLSFIGGQEYVLKGDFSSQKPGDNEGIITSRDVRLSLDVGEILDANQDVLITSTFGLPENLEDKVILGPYGIFVEDVDELDEPITITLQSQDVATGKIQFWDGDKWVVVKAEVDGDKASFEIEKLGVIVLTE